MLVGESGSLLQEGEVWENCKKLGREENEFRLERHANKAMRYILYSVRDLEAKRLCLVFLEDRGILRGWVLLADKLCSLGIVLPTKDKVDSSIASVKEGRRGEVQVEKEEKKWFFIEVAKTKVGRIGDAMWLQLRGRALRSREEQLGRCLVG